MGISIRACKAKGRRLQNRVRDLLREAFPKLEEDDVKSQTMGMSGEDIVMSPLAKRKIKYSFECKNKEPLDLWASLVQAEENCEDRTPVLVFKKNHSKTYVAFELDHFISLIQE